MSHPATAIVIGAGLAGTVTAARLKSHGVDVTVLTNRPGATIMHGGGWYLGLRKLPKFGIPSTRIDEALDFVEQGLSELALTDGPFQLVDVDGVQRVVGMAPATHAAAANLSDSWLIADFKPIGHPFAQMISTGRVISVDYPQWNCFGRSFAAVAARLESEAEQDTLIEALKTAIGSSKAEGLLLPPILGLSVTESLRTRLEQALNMPVAEALGTMPSTPGIRLHRALLAWLERLEITVEYTEVKAIETAALQVITAEQTYTPDALILATGGPVPGGLTAKGCPREPLAGLRITPELPMNLMRAVLPDRPFDGALFRAGVAVDSLFRPIGHDGTPVNTKLFAVGDLVGGPEGIVDRCASGLALTSGYLVADTWVAQ